MDILKLGNACISIMFVTRTILCGGEWFEAKSEHFKVFHYKNINEANKVARMAEECYFRVTSEIGLPQRSDFWKWERRINIKIHPDFDSFQKATGAPQWAGGKSNMGGREISTWEGSGNMREGVFPHEIAHLILKSYFKERKIPLWFEEGITQWVEKNKREMITKNSLYPAFITDPFPIENFWQCESAILLGDNASIFYIQSLSLIAFLMNYGGANSFGILCRRIKDGKNIEEALRFTYPDIAGTINELVENWLKFEMDKKLN